MHKKNTSKDCDNRDNNNDNNSISTNINHKGLQRTANENAEERRTYKDLISKNNNVDILKFCKQNTAMLIVLRENYSARHQHDTERTQNRARL